MLGVRQPKAASKTRCETPNIYNIMMSNNVASRRPNMLRALPWKMCEILNHPGRLSPSKKNKAWPMSEFSVSK